MNRAPRVVHLNREAYDVRIDRQTRWGNPFVIGRDGTREQVITKYRDWIMQPENAHMVEFAKRELRGKVLGCWCAPKPCHGDVLLEIANACGEAPTSKESVQRAQRELARDLAGDARRRVEPHGGLPEPLCPRPFNGRPDGFTMAQCILAGECGCTKAACAARAAVEPPECIHPWERIGINADGNPFCVQCLCSLVKEPPWSGARPLQDFISNARTAEAPPEHKHTDECWEPDSGCDLGRNEQYAERVVESKAINLLPCGHPGPPASICGRHLECGKCGTVLAKE